MTAPVIAPAHRLAPRELEVLKLVAEGYKVKEIAEQLGVSEQHVKNRRSILLRTVGAANVIELTHYALAHGIVANMFDEQR